MARTKRYELNVKLIGTESSLQLAHMILVGLSDPRMKGHVDIKIGDKDLFDHRNLKSDGSVQKAYEELINKLKE